MHLVQDMLNQVLLALCGSKRVSKILVLTREQLVLPYGVERIADAGRDLNSELDAAIHQSRGRGAGLILVIHADLPCLTSDEVDMLIEQGSKSSVALAPDHRNSGTNALVLDSSVPLHFQFGGNSFVRHCRQARLLGVDPAVVNSPGLAFDVDLPEDWQRLQFVSGERLSAHAG